MLLLPDNVRIRRYNLSSKQYSDYIDNAEHIQALDYIWDPEDQGLSKTTTLSRDYSQTVFCIVECIHRNLASINRLMKPDYINSKKRTASSY